MRAVGEALGLGRTFPEAFLKAFEGREDPAAELDLSRLGEPRPERWDLPGGGASWLELPGIAPYFAEELHSIAAAERELAETGDVVSAKRFGLPDALIARVLGIEETEVRRRRPLPGRLAVDSCAAEFEAKTPYFYLSYEPADDDGRSPSGRAVLVLGSGPNRIGQGIEFDYCCVHAAQAFRRLGYESVLLNSNPETVSTDYDTSDRLYLEPVTLERVLDVCALEEPLGVVVSLGGQTPLRLAEGLAEAGVPLLGDPLPSIRAAEDRGRFAEILGGLGLQAPAWMAVESTDEARAAAERIGYPVLVRPHYVLGGSGMRIARSAEDLELAGPALIDEFLEDAIELDVDCLCDGNGAWVAAILEQVERAGVHSGDSACVLPAPSVGPSSRRRSGPWPPGSRAPSTPAACSTSSSPSAAGSSGCSRRIRGPHGRSRSSPRPRACRSSSTPAGSCSARASTSSSFHRVPNRRAPGPRRRSSRGSASRARANEARRCARRER